MLITMYLSETTTDYRDDNLITVDAPRELVYSFFVDNSLQSMKYTWNQDGNKTDEEIFETWLDSYTADSIAGIYNYAINNGYTFGGGLNDGRFYKTT